MAGRRTIIIFWLLLLIPALTLAGVALRMVGLEAERMKGAAAVAFTDQARTAGDALDLSLGLVQDNLTRALENLDDRDRAGLASVLATWERTNPLVRNVFIFDPERGLVYPERSMAATREERLFVARFNPLFTGRIPFETAGPVPDSQAEGKPAKNPARSSARQSLYELSKAPDLAAPAAEPGPGIKSAWLPWFSENRLHILGWVQKSDRGPVYGVELEMMTLLSRLAADFPADPGPGRALALVDGSGLLIHRAGDPGVDTDQKALAAVEVSPRFPHWQIRVFAREAGAGPGKTFSILALALLGLLLLSILAGGILLTRLTLDRIRDARKKTSFVASVSHELKTPLTSIRMYAELLLSGRAKGKEDRYLGVIVSQSLRLTRLINNVLDFGRLEQGKKTYAPAGVELVSFLTTLIRSQEVRLQAAGVEVVTDIQASRLEVETDRDALEQAVLNLIDNALKYAGDGKFLKVSLAKETDMVLIRLQDNGPGIAPAHREKIFEKFFRADDRITASQPGSGLGLSIARQMMRDLDGDILLDRSEKGAGFTIRIPVGRKGTGKREAKR